jgi:predicted metal-dependent hydrolase
MVSLVTNKVIVEDNSLTVLLPEGYRESIEQLLGKKQGWIHLHVGTPQKKRSTGPRSENNLIHGSCALIAEQLGYLETMGKGQATEYVKDAMKRMAVGSRGLYLKLDEQ